MKSRELRADESPFPTYDVIVVGFGPCGAVATCLLGQSGVRTLALDKSDVIWDKPRAIACDHEVLRVFQNIGVADAVLPHTAPFRFSDHYGVRGQLIRRIDVVSPPYPLGYNPTMVFTQPAVEAILRKRASELPSVTLALGMEVVRVEQSPDKVTLTIQNEEGKIQQVCSSFVIACDGASSSVRQMLSLPLDDLGFDEPWLVVDVKMKEVGLTHLPHTTAQYLNPSRPTTYLVGPGNHRRWEIMLRPGEDLRVMEREDMVWQLLSPWISREEGELWRASSYRFHALVAQQWRRGRVFLAGDAAHQQPPFMGQGMCQGIRDVANLTWKLHFVLNGARPSLLDTYTAERSLHVRTLIQRIKEIGRDVCERDPERAALRDERLLREGGGVAPTIIRQEFVPPLECGLLSDGLRPPVGTLFPQPSLLVSSEPLRMDCLFGHGWRIILDGRVEAASARNRYLGVVTGIVGGSVGVPETEGVLASWFDKFSCIGALVRPDHYVYAAIRDLAEIPLFMKSLILELGLIEVRS